MDYCNYTAPDKVPTAADLLATAKEFARLCGPPRKHEPGPDFKIGRRAYEVLREKFQRECPHVDMPFPPELMGLQFQIDDLMPPDCMVGMTEAGREIIKEMREAETTPGGRDGPC